MLRRHGVQFGMYADDLILFASDKSVDAATLKVQAAMDEVQEWADTWTMSISQAKTKSILFTSNVHEVNGKKSVTICLGDEIIDQVSSVTILGVTFDTQLTFNTHVQQLKSKLMKRLQVVKALAGTTWGCSSPTLRRLYVQFIQPGALYGSATYMQFCSQSTREKMDVVATTGARVITGCPAGTRGRATLAEANIRSISSLAEQQGAVLRERILRLPEDVPARATTVKPVQRRLPNRRSWREQATLLAAEAGLEDLPREGATLPCRPPWLSTGKGKIRFDTSAKGTTSRIDSPEIRKAAAESALAALPPADCHYFTDGSTEEGFGKGGGGIIRDDRLRGQVSWSVPAGRWTSSYRSEQMALLAAIQDAEGAPKELKTVRFCTDSLSLVIHLSRGRGNSDTESITKIWSSLASLSRLKKDVQVVWIPGHAEIEGNEKADQAANEGRGLTQDQVGVDLPSAKAALRSTSLKKWMGTYNTTVPPEHIHRRATGGRCLKYEKDWSRQEQVVLHQLRTNRCPLLQATLHRWNRPDTDGLCPECGVLEDTEHYICDCQKY